MARTLYLITNKINNKKYVGQAKDFKDRVSSHCKSHANPSLIYHAVQKYGKDNFIFEPLAIVEDIFIDDAEIKAIQVFNTLVPNGYNLDHGGCKNKVMSEESRKKMSIAGKGRTPWNKDKKCKPSWNKGIPATEEVKKRLSTARVGKEPPNKGKPMSEETKQKLREINKGQVPPNKGKKMSEEQKRLLSEIKRGKPSPKKGKKYTKVNGL